MASTSGVLWQGNCYNLSVCHRLSFRSVGLARSRRFSCSVAARNRIRACNSTVSTDKELQKASDDVGSVGISSGCLHSEDRQPCESLDMIECNGIVSISRLSSECIPPNHVENSSTRKSDTPTKYYGDSELLSRCTSVAERSAIALATMAYERAKRLFNLVSVNLTDLEINFRKRSKAFGFSSAADSDVESNGDEFKRLNQRVMRLEQELNEKDEKLQLALMEAKDAHEELMALRDSGPRVIHDVEIISDDFAVEKSNGWFNEAEARSTEELNLVEEKVAGLLEKVGHLNSLVAGWKNAFTLLQLESEHSSEALQISAQELLNAKMHIQKLKELTESQTSNINSKNEQLAALKGELHDSKLELENLTKSLSAAGQQRRDTEEHIKDLEKALKHEKETIAAVIRSSSSQKESLVAAEKKVSSLTSELTSLKSLVEGKEELISAMREEARRNANMLVSAAKTRESLLIAEKRIEQLNNQVNALEEEVKSRDLVLNDIKEEAVQSTEALRLAAQIKQDLNLSRQRELELTQELESMKDAVKELRLEVVENNRAVRAEQALRQLESEMDELTAEVDILRKGVEARDEAIQLMKEEVDRNIDVLSHAAGNRELVRELEEHIEELKAELRKKDTMLAAMGKGLDTSSLYKSSYDESNYNIPSTSSSTSQSFVNEASKARKRVNRNTNTSTNTNSSYKRNPRHSS